MMPYKIHSAPPLFGTSVLNKELHFTKTINDDIVIASLPPKHRSEVLK